MANGATTDLIAREVFLASLASAGRPAPRAIRYFARKMGEVRLEEGGALYVRGDPAEHVYFVVSGEIRETGPDGAVSTFAPRELFGTFDATLRRPRQRSAQAARQTLVLALRVDDWAEFLEDHVDLARRAVTRLAAEVFALRLRAPPLGGFEDGAVAAPRSGGPLQVVDRILRLRAAPVFGRARFQTLAVLAQLGSSRFSADGRAMFERGEANGQLVIVASGSVEVCWEGSPRPARFDAGSLVGGAGALSSPPVLEIRAATGARAITLPVEDYFDVMEEHFDLVESALVALAAERQGLLERGR